MGTSTSVLLAPAADVSADAGAALHALEKRLLRECRDALGRRSSAAASDAPAAVVVEVLRVVETAQRVLAAQPMSAQSASFFDHLRRFFEFREGVEALWRTQSTGAIERIAQLTPPGTTVQDRDTLDAVYLRAADVRRPFALLLGAAARLAGLDACDGTVVMVPPLKSLNRASEKMENEYGRQPPLRGRYLLDILRGAIICDSEAQLVAVLHFFMRTTEFDASAGAAPADHGASSEDSPRFPASPSSDDGALPRAAPLKMSLVRLKNRFRQPHFSGMRDVLVNIRLDGFVTEVQVRHRLVHAYCKRAKSHEHYTFFRSYFNGCEEDSLDRSFHLLANIEGAAQNYDGEALRLSATLRASRSSRGDAVPSETPRSLQPKQLEDVVAAEIEHATAADTFRLENLGDLLESTLCEYLLALRVWSTCLRLLYAATDDDLGGAPASLLEDDDDHVLGMRALPSLGNMLKSLRPQDDGAGAGEAYAGIVAVEAEYDDDDRGLSVRAKFRALRMSRCLGHISRLSRRARQHDGALTTAVLALRFLGPLGQRSDDTVLCKARVDVARCLTALRRYDDAVALLQGTVALLGGTGGGAVFGDTFTLAAALVALAAALSARGSEHDADAARAAAGRAVQLLEAGAGADADHDASVAEATSQLAALTEASDEKLADALHARAVDIRCKAVGDKHALVARDLNNYAHFMAKTGALDVAVALAERAVTIDAGGSNSINLATSRSFLAGVYVRCGRHDDAVVEYDAAILIHDAAASNGGTVINLELVFDLINRAKLKAPDDGVAAVHRALMLLDAFEAAALSRDDSDAIAQAQAAAQAALGHKRMQRRDFAGAVLHFRSAVKFALRLQRDDGDVDAPLNDSARGARLVTPNAFQRSSRPSRVSNDSAPRAPQWSHRRRSEPHAHFGNLAVALIELEDGEAVAWARKQVNLDVETARAPDVLAAAYDTLATACDVSGDANAATSYGTTAADLAARCLGADHATTREYRAQWCPE
mmetsp:Transcript_9339/g.32856  ORF Transcript_9339/g.32856 Transcript_9339/m.32856 type:complete len:998 (+) Transcript_9339:2-2995(+)